jgi:hypothetical protein
LVDRSRRKDLDRDVPFFVVRDGILACATIPRARSNSPKRERGLN